MKTQIFNTSNDSLMKAAAIIKKGGLIAFPTETVYGLGANGLNEEAVKNIFKAKGRPNDNPLILHISQIQQITQLTDELPKELKKLSIFMPGPLTIVVKKSKIVPDVVTAGLDTVGIRIPMQPVAREFISLCNLPIAAPSANISGRPSPTKVEHVIEDLSGKIDGIIDGGVCSVGVESTVLDLTSEIPTILRPGGITKEQLESVLGDVDTNYKEDGDRPSSPGVKYKHYTPNAPLIITRGDILSEAKKHKGKKIGILTVGSSISLDSKSYVVISLGKTPKEYASNLFAKLREFDEKNVDIIISQDIKGNGICEAVRNRLYKAASSIKDD